MIVCFALAVGFIGCDKDKDNNNDVAVTGVSLDKAILTLEVGETETLTATIAPSDATNKNVTWNSDKPTIATVENGIVTAVAEGTATITVTTKDGGKTAICTVTVIESVPIKEWVEINGVKWAKCNVNMPGTFTANPEDAGMFYQWNRKIGWSNADPMVNSDGGTTWDDSYPDGETWETSNDPSPLGYRVPTLDEIEKLLDETKVTYTKVGALDIENGVPGRRFTDKTSGESIFLPAAGYRYGSGGTLYGVGTIGDYWSSTQLEAGNAYGLYFYDSFADWYHYYRTYGFSVRPVAE